MERGPYGPVERDAAAVDRPFLLPTYIACLGSEAGM